MKYYCPPVNPRTIYVLNLLKCKDYGDPAKDNTIEFSQQKCKECTIKSQCLARMNRRARRLLRSQRVG